MRLGIRVSFALITSGFLVAACGSVQEASMTATPTTGTTARVTTEPPVPTAGPTTTSTPRPTPTAIPVPTGELVVTLPVLDFNLNGVVASATSSLLDPLYTAFIGTKIDGQLDGSAGAVTTWTANADSSVWTFKVRNDFNFHNGERASAQDAAWSLQLAWDPQVLYGRGQDLINSVAKVETLDDATMVVSLKKPDFFWNVIFLSRTPPFALPKRMLSKKYVTSIGLTEANKAPVGSGPYKFKSVTVGDRVVLEAIEKHFYFGVPKTKTLTVTLIPEEVTRLALLTNKTADIAPISLQGVAKAKQAGLGVTTRVGGDVWTIWNSQYPDTMPGYGPNPFTKEAVRKALFWYAIDRKSLVDSFLLGEGTPSMDFPLMKWDVGGFKSLAVPSYDLAKAKAMLVSAGYPAGFEVDFYMDQATTLSVGVEVMEAIAVSWERAGIKVNRMPFTTGLFNTKIRAVYDKGGFTKPTISGLIKYPNTPINNVTAVSQHDSKAVYAVNRDPEGLRLASAFAQATSMDFYRQNGETYRQYVYEHASTFAELFEGNEFLARTAKVGDQWQLGRDTPLYRLDYAAAVR